MKKVNWIILVGFIAAVSLFTSCDGGETTVVGPEIVYQNYDGGDLALASGQDTTISFVVNKGDAALESVAVVIEQTAGDVPYYTATSVEDGMIVPLEISLEVPGTYVLKIVVTDKDAVVEEKTINVTVSSDLEVSSVILGAGANTNGSYFTTTGKTDMNGAAAAPATVLFAYTHDGTTGIIKSGSVVTNTVISAGASETTFQIIEGVDAATAVSADIPADMTATTINVAAGDVVAFSNANGVGVFEVISIEGTTAGQASLTIAVKVIE